RDERVRLRPDFRARLLRADHGGDERGSQGRDQPPGPRAARPGPGHRRTACRIAPHRPAACAGSTRRIAPHRPAACAAPPGRLRRTARRTVLRGRRHRYGSRRGPFHPEEGARVSKLEPGDEAPDFTLTDADGRQVTLSSLRGQRVIVYFYPAAMTPRCTT